MKKFLFTLAALLMAGSVCAEEYFYIDDITIPAEEAAAGATVVVPVKAHFDYYVNAWQVDFVLPEGVVCTKATRKPDMYIDYLNEDLEEDQYKASLGMNEDKTRFIVSTFTELGYTEDGECYGSLKWDPGDYSNMWEMTLVFPAGFTGGEITVITEPSSTDDTRGPICPKGQHNERVAAVTVEGGGEPIVTDAPEIVVTPGDDAYIFDVVGPEGAELKLFVDGVEVEFPYTVVRTDVDQIIKLTATAHIEGQTDGSVTGEYLVPALVVPDLSGEIVIGEPDENGVVVIDYTGDEDVTVTVTVNGEDVELGEDGTITIGEGENVIVVTVTAEGYNDLTETKTVTYEPEPPMEKTENPTFTIFDDPEAQTVTVTGTGNGHITILWDEQLVAEGDGEAVWVIPYGDDPEGEEFGFTVYAQEDGKEISDPVNGEVVVPGKPAEPQPTATPVIIVTVNEDNVVISAEGEGEVILMIDGEVVDNPTTIVRGEEDVVVTVTATAQAEGQLISETATEVVTIPAYVDDPEGHMTGYWLILFDKDGNEVWQKLENTNSDDPNQYVTTAALHYSQFGGRPLKPGETDEVNPMVPFYFMIDGVRYACEDALVEPVYGNANENPLFETENCWVVPVGYFYTIGVLVDPINEGLLLQISKGVYTGIEELNGDKAVAGVRYFNMAGQEMQEANGMTIVVTTYTDGTTSAVKVMK